MKKYFLMLASFMAYISAMTSDRGEHGSNCYAGYAWNEEKAICEKCPIGFQNINCAEQCMYPSFGEECQEECACSKRFCDFKLGCREQRSSPTRHLQDTSASSFKSGFKDVTAPATTKTGLLTTESPKGTDLILYGIFILVGILVVFLGIFVAAYLYKLCSRKRTVSVGYGTARSTYVESYKGLGSQPRKENNDISESENLSSDPFYLDPISKPTTCHSFGGVQSSSDADNVYLEVIENDYENETCFSTNGVTQPVRVDVIS